VIQGSGFVATTQYASSGVFFRWMDAAISQRILPEARARWAVTSIGSSSAALGLGETVTSSRALFGAGSTEST